MTSELRVEYRVVPMGGQYMANYKYLTTHREWRYVACPETGKAKLFPTNYDAKEAAIVAVSAILNTKIRFQSEDAPATAGAGFLDVQEWTKAKQEDRAISHTFRHKKTMKPVIVEHKGKRRDRS